ncbi:MAG: hypothetical protein CVT68_07475 [Actinobacteria bacterium HGW-Actinobacteria-8]|nr:MAG: hypothetical protein CVT68_07475 [Actinobacteria bacterium HGW-Actinobacteria-8]
MGILGALVLVAYVGAEAWATRSVAPGVTVLDVDLGGLARDDAYAALVAKAQDVNAAPIALEVAGYTTSIDPAVSGMEMDADETLDRVAGFTMDPRRLLAHLAGGGEVEPALHFDADALAAAVDAAAADLDRDKRSAVVTLEGAHAVVEEGSPAIALDGEGTTALLRETWPAVGRIEPPAEVIEPEVPTSVALDFQTHVDENIFSAPVKLVGPNGTVTLDPEHWCKYASVESFEGTLSLVVDGEALATDILIETPSLNNEARGASVRFDAVHQLVVDEGRPGRTIDPARLGERVVNTAATATRTSALPYTVTAVEPPAGDVDVRDFVERVSSFSTVFSPRGWAREENIAQAAEYITGTIVRPGETFSLGDAISPVTYERGYVDAGAIVDGEHIDVRGGGLSQMATTMYNAAYWAGVVLVKYKAHSEWFSRYPPGREATIFLPNLDMQWRNDTPYSIVINSYAEHAQIHVDFWSTHYYDVEASQSSNPPSWWGVGCAKPAFSITDYRKVLLDGTVVKDESRPWSYRAVDFCESAD